MTSSDKAVYAVGWLAGFEDAEVKSRNIGGSVGLQTEIGKCILIDVENEVVIELEDGWLSGMVFALAFVGAFVNKLVSTLAIDLARALESAVLKLVERSKQKKGDDRKGKRPPRR